MVKFNSKSTVWYRPDKFTDVPASTSPKDWDALQGSPRQLKAKGSKPLGLGAVRLVDPDRLVREHLRPPGRS